MPGRVVLSAPRFYGVDTAIARGFEALGFEVASQAIPPASARERMVRAAGRIVRGARGAAARIAKAAMDEVNSELLRLVDSGRPSLVMIVKGGHIYPETLERIRRTCGSPVVSYVWDDPFRSYTSNREDPQRLCNFLDGLDLYDHVFVYDPHHTGRLRQRRPAGVSYLPLGCDPVQHRPVNLTEDERRRWRHQVAFVGSPYPNRQAAFERLRAFDLGVYGDGWREYYLRRGRAWPKYVKGGARGRKVLAIYAAADVVLNVHDPEATDGVNTRTFEILACGAFEIVDYKKSLEEHFTVGREIVAFANLDELHDQVRYYLDRPELRRDIAARGRSRVLREHTWTSRIRALLSRLAEGGLEVVPGSAGRERS